MTEKNIPLLRDTMDAIEANPESHSQGTWRCETTACFAGHAALLAGGEWLASYSANSLITHFGIFDQYPGLTNGSPWVYMLAEPEDDGERVEETNGVKVIHVAYRAARVLGLDEREADELFNGGNTRLWLRHLVDSWSAGKGPYDELFD